MSAVQACLPTGDPIKYLNIEAKMSFLDGYIPCMLSHIDTRRLSYPDCLRRENEKFCIWYFAGL
jgi:hypothetical protein